MTSDINWEILSRETVIWFSIREIDTYVAQEQVAKNSSVWRKIRLTLCGSSSSAIAAAAGNWREWIYGKR